MNYKLNANAGGSFDVVALKAKRIATEKNVTVEFDFNGVTCLVDKDTNTDWLYRDYSNSWIMDWKVVGPNCLAEYGIKTKAEFEKRRAWEKEKSDALEKAYEIKQAKEKNNFDEKVKGVKLELSDVKGWNKSRKVNSDGYGSAALDYAEGWAKMMQIEIAKGKTIAECYDYSQKELGFLGITGFQFGCAVSILAQTWKHGEELRSVHNKKYGVSGEIKGTVNPAVITIGSK